MKHRRSIELVPGHEAVQTDMETPGTLPQWYVLHARCPACQHQTQINRGTLAYGPTRDVSLAGIGRRLICTACGNRRTNELLIGKLPRD